MNMIFNEFIFTRVRENENTLFFKILNCGFIKSSPMITNEIAMLSDDIQIICTKTTRSSETNANIKIRIENGVNYKSIKTTNKDTMHSFGNEPFPNDV